METNKPKRVREVDRKALEKRIAARLELCRRCGKVATGINVILGPSCSKACSEAYFQEWKEEKLDQADYENANEIEREELDNLNGW